MNKGKGSWGVGALHACPYWSEPHLQIISVETHWPVRHQAQSGCLQSLSHWESDVPDACVMWGGATADFCPAAPN